MFACSASISARQLIRSLTTLEHVFRVGFGGRSITLARMNNRDADRLDRGQLLIFGQHTFGGGDDGAGDNFDSLRRKPCRDDSALDVIQAQCPLGAERYRRAS